MAEQEKPKAVVGARYEDQIGVATWELEDGSEVTEKMGYQEYVAKCEATKFKAKKGE